MIRIILLAFSLFILVLLTKLEAKCQPRLTLNPSAAPTFLIFTKVPTNAPTITSTDNPTIFNINSPAPTAAMTSSPTISSSSPSLSNSEVPTISSTESPSISGSNLAGSNTPLQVPTVPPSISPTITNTNFPTLSPITSSNAPITSGANDSTPSPSTDLTSLPTLAPSNIPSIAITAIPTEISSEPVTSSNPTVPLTTVPTAVPTIASTPIPSTTPTLISSHVPTYLPSILTSPIPSTVPTLLPTAFPSFPPTANPSTHPSVFPTSFPSTARPTRIPTTSIPTNVPSYIPSPSPSAVPTAAPTAPLQIQLTMNLKQDLSNINYTSFSSNPEAAPTFSDAVANSVPGLNSSEVSVTNVQPISSASSSSSSVTQSAIISPSAVSFIFPLFTQSKLQHGPFIYLEESDGITIYYTLQFYIESLGYSDYNYALNQVLDQLNQSIADHQFIESLQAFATHYHIARVFSHVQSSPVVYLSSSVTETPTTVNSNDHLDQSQYKNWPMYAQALFIIGVVIIAVLCGVGMYYLFLSCKAPLSSFHSTMNMRNDFVRRLQLSRSLLSKQQKKNDSTGLKGVQLTENPTIINAPIETNNPAAAAAAAPATLEQQFIDLVLREENSGGSSKSVMSANLLQEEEQASIMQQPPVQPVANGALDPNSLPLPVISPPHDPNEEKEDIVLLPPPTPTPSSIVPQQSVHQTPLSRLAETLLKATPIKSSLKAKKDLPPSPAMNTFPPTGASMATSGIGTTPKVGRPSILPSEITMEHFLPQPPLHAQSLHYTPALHNEASSTGLMAALEYLTPQQQRAVQYGKNQSDLLHQQPAAPQEK